MTDWTARFCGCMDDVPSCLCSCFLPCVQYGRNAERYGHGILGEEKLPNCLGFMCFSFFGLSFIPTLLQRTSIRTKYDIEGGPIKDCLSSFCCTCCTLSQHHRELVNRDKLVHVVHSSS
ncbi:PLAC8 family [Pelomyxa schiedti]|nr:PLAC8 family [Pelomyxa schiedti]